MEEKSNCQHCKTWEEEMYWKNFNCLQFFQILSKDFHDHLVLPEKFSAHMTTQLPEKVSLTGPGGNVWDVEVQKNDNLLLVGDGWKDFVEAYNLDENCLLMFKYKRNWGFEVLFLDRESLCEKEASYFVKKCRHTKSDHKVAKKHTKKTVREDSCTDALEDDNEDPELFVSKKHKKDVIEETNRLRRKKYIEDLSNQKSNAAARGRARKVRPRRMVAPSNPPEETPARDEVIQEESPISLPYTISPENEGSYPEKGLAEELKDNSEKTPTGNDTAQKVNPISVRDWSTPDDREVSSEMNHYDKPNSSGKEPSGTAENPSQVFGRELVMLDCRERSHEANHSQQLKRKRGRLMNLATPKSSRKQASRSHAKEYRSNRRAVTEMEKSNALRKAALERTGNSFIVVMRPTSVYRRFYMSIPAIWINKHLPLQHMETVLRVGNKTWHTMFYYNQKRRVGGICPGWKKFALDNSLEESDALLFTLIKQNSDEAAIVFDVKIFRVVPEIIPPLLVGSSTF